MTPIRALIAALVIPLIPPGAAVADEPAAAVPGKVSYYKDVRPILAQHCNGCHQPARAKSGYVMTDFASLVKGGDTGPAVVPGLPAKSYLVRVIDHEWKVEGGIQMPPPGQLKKPLVETITAWVAEGAVDDTPLSAKAVRVDAANPPEYAAPPVVTSVAFEPTGKYLAVSGYHEVLLYDAKTLALTSRLIGLSERINAVAFSPDGSKLAAVGGSPGRFGEVQIWNPATAELIISAPFTFDTLNGASWSPDGALVAFGCTDNTVRAIDALDGKQVLQMGTHSDWVLDTAFSQDGKHLVSVGRDMSMKLTDVPTQRFIDNVTSITPGALKGGLTSVDRRPVETAPVHVRFFGTEFTIPRTVRMQKVPPDTPGVPAQPYDELLVGGSDGIPRLYKMHRESKRVIGDDANKVRDYAAMPGRVYAVAFAPDGKHFAAASSLDGTGEVRVYETDTGKHVPCEKVTGPVYAVAFAPDGKTVASAGFDGTVWLHDAATGKLLTQAVAVPKVAAKTGAE